VGTPREERLGWFDRFADSTGRFTSRATFFAACVLLVVIWLPSYFLLRNLDTWQLVINTITMIVTFLLVALLQNTQRRGEEAIQAKLDAIADPLADLMEEYADERREAVPDVGGFARDIRDLR
jgi:low affinity Fe/Cu permease